MLVDIYHTWLIASHLNCCANYCGYRPWFRHSLICYDRNKCFYRLLVRIWQPKWQLFVRPTINNLACVCPWAWNASEIVITRPIWSVQLVVQRVCATIRLKNALSIHLHRCMQNRPLHTLYKVHKSIQSAEHPRKSRSITEANMLWFQLNLSAQWLACICKENSNYLCKTNALTLNDLEYIFNQFTLANLSRAAPKVKVQLLHTLQLDKCHDLAIGNQRITFLWKF